MIQERKEKNVETNTFHTFLAQLYGPSECILFLLSYLLILFSMYILSSTCFVSFIASPQSISNCSYNSCFLLQGQEAKRLMPRKWLSFDRMEKEELPFTVTFFRENSTNFLSGSLAGLRSSWQSSAQECFLYSRFLCPYLKLQLAHIPQFTFKLLLLFSCQVVDGSLQPHGLQHFRLPCPSPSSRVCSNSCPSSGWCHLSSFTLFSFCLQSFQASGSWVRMLLFSHLVVFDSLQPHGLQLAFK